jgi:hypothetical protein
MVALALLEPTYLTIPPPKFIGRAERTVKTTGITDNQLRDRNLCKMEQTRAFAISIMMFKVG